ncbi:hypothetical protein SAMN04489842_3366 [Natronobacterium texcoconense]|uniref:Lipoprotein n=2 Tax=Natronobacterium texcoconense TaxID=1095778 RepID=A0A1H1IAE9_NATTX|nr:hypothetical protein SAMN04489842_3366 [Natronobacterium texcoconense]
MSLPSTRRSVLLTFATATSISLSGCLSGDLTSNVEEILNEDEDRQLLFIVLNNNTTDEQQIDVRVEKDGEPVVEASYELPPAGTSRADVAGTTPASQYMIEPNWSDEPAAYGIRVRYPESDSWVEKTVAEGDHEHVGAWVTLWPTPEVGIIGYPESETEVAEGDRAERRVTVPEVEDWIESFLEDQGEREYHVESG